MAAFEPMRGFPEGSSTSGAYVIVRAKLLGVLLLLASGTYWSPAEAQVTLPEEVKKGQAP